jgi:hypothetical protein
MAFIRYEEAQVQVGYGSPSNELYATNVTVGESLPLTPIRSLGFNGAIAIAPSGPVEGTWSVSYGLFATAARPLMCATGPTMSSPAAWQDPTDSEFIVAATYDPDAAITMSIGDATTNLFEKGFATSFSLSAEPNAVVTATANGNFYDCSMLLGADGITAGAVGDGEGTFNPAFGGNVSIVEGSAGFSCKPFSASYEYTRGASPIYTLGEVAAKFVAVSDPQQSLTLQGSNLPYSVVSDPAGDSGCDYCTQTRELSFVVDALCGDAAVGDYTVCGLVTSRDIEVAVDDILRGNITVVDYTVKQKISSISCD